MFALLALVLAFGSVVMPAVFADNNASNNPPATSDGNNNNNPPATSNGCHNNNPPKTAGCGH